jgi:NitT/TauT family transport system permease protein
VSTRSTLQPSRRNLTGIFKRLLVWVAVLTVWELAYRIIGWRDWLFPAPSHVLDALLEMLNVQSSFGDPLGPGWPFKSPHGATLTDVLHSPLLVAQVVSGTRLLAGFVISIVLGGVLGLCMWRLRWLDDFLGPLFLGLQTLPSVCWVPLAVLTLGISESGILFVLVMGSFFAIAISLRDGLRQIPPIYQRAGHMLGARRLKMYRHVLLPASMPALASSLRSGFSFAWRSLMGAEFVLIAVKLHGVGYLLDVGRNFNDVAQVVAIMIVMVVIGMLADRLVFAKLEQRVHARFGLATA